jgi:hypothetical protein
MDSSVDFFMVFASQLVQRSALIRALVASGKVQSIDITGRVVGVGPTFLMVRGRGCEVEVNLAGANRFTFWKPKDFPFVTMRPNDPGWASRPLWEVRWPRGDRLLISEEPPTPKV